MQGRQILGNMPQPGVVRKVVRFAVAAAAARAHGRSADLEAAALRVALKARPVLPANRFMSLNVSPELLRTEKIREIWRGQGNLGGLVIELTEQTPVDSYLELDPDLNQLRAAGALIGVDDAGAGYAGLRHLGVVRMERMITALAEAYPAMKDQEHP